MFNKRIVFLMAFLFVLSPVVAMAAITLTLTAPTDTTVAQGEQLGPFSAEVVEEKFVSVGDNGTILTSSDGVTWTSRTSGTTKTLTTVSFTNSIFTTVGESGTILTSSDGSTWISKTSGTSNWLIGATYGNGVYVVTGRNGTILTSSDGVTWTSTTSGTTVNLSEVIYANNLFVALGDSGTILTSSDGVTWTSTTSGTTQNLSEIIYANNNFVIVGSGGTILTSSDGVTWTSRTSGTTNWLSGAAYGNNIYVITGNSGTILTSSDGATWTKRTSGSSVMLSGVTYGKNIFVASGYSGTILTSSDGVTWTSTTSGATVDISEVSFGNCISSDNRLLVLTRDSQSLDSEETKITDFLTQNGYSYDTADATDISNGSVSASSYKVIYFRTGSEPTGYNSTSVISAIQSAVEGGSSLIVEYYGNYLVKYLGWGSVTSASWSPAVYDKLAYVKSITSHEIFDGISTWDPPTEPDKEEQYIWSLNKTGSCTCKDLSLTSAEKIEYWELYITYGWNGQSTNSSYCQSWGGCTSDRSVRSNSIRYAMHGSGKVIHPYGAGIGHSNCNSPITLGTAGTSLMKNILNWAGASSTPAITQTLTPPTTTTVSKGSRLGPFSVSLTNNTSSSYSFYVYLYIGTPDGNWFSISPSRLMTLSGGQIFSTGNLYIRVPSIAQTGTTYYQVNIYDTSYNVIDEDWFSF